jgi:hypothetical protein
MVKRKKVLYILLGSLLICLTGAAFYLHTCLSWPDTKKDRWSIGIYTGSSPFKLHSPENIKNPVLTARDVKDAPTLFVADPFIFHENSKWYLFFEIKNHLNFRGEIGLAESPDGFHWTYKQEVLREPFHLSFPNVFKYDNDYYMIPESFHAKSIRLYKADQFPNKWSLAGILVKGRYVDPVLLNYQGKWWLFAGNPPHNLLYLFYADNLGGPWIMHPKCPLVKSPHTASPAGKILQYQGRIFRFAQDTKVIYGNTVRAFEITKLTPTEYEEKAIPENPILSASGMGWNRDGMHTFNLIQLGPKQWIASVDGFGYPY